MKPPGKSQQQQRALNGAVQPIGSNLEKTGQGILQAVDQGMKAQFPREKSNKPSGQTKEKHRTLDGDEQATVSSENNSRQNSWQGIDVLGEAAQRRLEQESKSGSQAKGSLMSEHEESRLKEEAKEPSVSASDAEGFGEERGNATCTGGTNSKKRSSSNNGLESQEVGAKKARKHQSSCSSSRESSLSAGQLQQPNLQQQPRPPFEANTKPSESFKTTLATQNQRPNEDVDPEETFFFYFIEEAKKIYNDTLSLKNHFGLQCLIREWIAIAFSKRSFELLAKASNLAVTFCIGMDRILCGVDEATASEIVEGEVQKEQSKAKDLGWSKKPGSETSHSECFIGGRMNYLLSMLVEPRSSALADDVRYMRIPHLPASILSLVAPRSCGSLRELDLQDRWVMIRQTSHGKTKFYCSPMFEKNVMSLTHMTQAYEDDLAADVLSLVFSNGHFDQYLSSLAEQIVRKETEDSLYPAVLPNLKIRLLSKIWEDSSFRYRRTGLTKEMMNIALNFAPVISVDATLISFQTMDTHLYYLEFFSQVEPGQHGITDIHLPAPPLRSSILSGSVC
jgi:hypothetical protein